MVFQPEDVRSGLILSTEVNEESSNVALRVNNGSVQFEYLTTSNAMSLNVNGVREEEWYQLYASVYVAPLHCARSATILFFSLLGIPIS